MKFNYTDDNERGECVAYIDQDGDLVLPLYNDHGESVTLVQGGKAETGYEWNPENATKKFYKGDKLEITF